MQTRMQIINPSAGGLYTGLSNAVSTIYRIEGLRTLWRGVSSVIVGAGMQRQDSKTSCIGLTRTIGPAHAVYFGTYEVVKEFAGGNVEDGKHHPGAAGLSALNQWDPDGNTDFLLAFSGACATIASDALMNPFDGKDVSLTSRTAADLLKLLNNACKYMAPHIPRSRNALASSTEPKVSQHSTSPTPQHYA